MDPIETAEVSCPCCGASVQMLLDPTGGLDQEYVEDCEVCCRPWQVHVTYRESVPHVDLRALDET
jgi:hypothetical protein